MKKRLLSRFSFVLPKRGLEPLRAIRSLEPESSASANSATSAFDTSHFSM